MARPRRTSAASEVSTVMDQQQELGSMYDYLAKIILLGPSGSGKSCLLHRFVKGEWRILSSQTIGVEFASKIVKIGTGAGRRKVKLQLWDTAGTERFRSVSRSYYRGAAGAILVYDVASLTSFNALPTFLMDARALASPNLTLILAGNKADLTVEAPKPQNGNTTEPPLPTPSNASTSSKQSSFPYDASAGGSIRSQGGGSIGPGNHKWTATTAAEGREVTPDLASRWASRSAVPVTMEVSALSGDNVEELFNRLARMILTKIELGEIDPDDPQSGIQYGDATAAAWADGASIRSGTTIDDGGGTLRQRKNRGGKGLLSAVGEWEDVFRTPVGSGRGRRGGCC